MENYSDEMESKGFIWTLETEEIEIEHDRFGELSKNLGKCDVFADS